MPYKLEINGYTPQVMSGGGTYKVGKVVYIEDGVRTEYEIGARVGGTVNLTGDGYVSTSYYDLALYYTLVDGTAGHAIAPATIEGVASLTGVGGEGVQPNG